MGIFIRQADLERDRDLLISMLFNHLTRLSNDRRFRWLYCDNPHGPASAWLAIDEVSGEPVGASAAFPREMYVDGKKRSGWVLGDFCISGEHRSLGPALQLQRATLNGIHAGRTDLCYDFPSRQMTAIYKRMGINPVAELVRLTKPLRLEPQLKQFTRSEFLSKTLGWTSNKFLRVTDHQPWLKKKRSGLSISFHTAGCGPEFSALLERLEPKDGISLSRSAEYLNWRYLHHPNVAYRIITARKGDELQGYVIFSCDSDRADIAEFCAVNHETLSSLLDALTRHLRKTSVNSLNAFVTETDPRKTFLEQSGFWARESAPLMVYWPSESDKKVTCRWLLSQGDRES